MATSDDVRRIALSQPETSEGPLYGTPGFRVKDKAFARPRDEGETLVIWLHDEYDKEALIATQPNIFFTLPHYPGHPSVLVRLAAIDDEELREVLTEAWRVRAPRRLRAAHAPESPARAE